MDRTAFLLACRDVMESDRERRGIGTLGEKSLHAVLKRYFEPRTECHEIQTGPYVADVRNEAGFLEIQTRDFRRLRDKLDLFLRQAPVTVVYPVPAVKWVIWLEEDGRASSRRKSPKRATVCEILPELYQIKPLLSREGLRFSIVLLEVEEYRLKNGWGEDGKRGASRFDRLPVALLDQISLGGPEDFAALVPQALPPEFTVREFGKAAALSPKKASAALNVLYSLGTVRRVGKVRNAYLYQRSDHLPDPVPGA